jgi:GNAT superfamily N-acetyltransferase
MAEEPPLETGYGPAVPLGDNLCNDFVQESARSFAAFATARGDRVARVEGTVTMTDAGSPIPFFNRAMLECPVREVDALVGELRAFYSSDRDPSVPFLLDWATPPLGAHGFALMGHPPLMMRPAHSSLPTPPRELRICPVVDERTARDFEHTLAYGYPAPPLQPVKTATLFTPAALTASGWRHFVGYEDDRPVTAGSAYVGDRLIRVDNIATLQEARGRGYGRAITAAAIGVGLSKPAMLIASDLGRPIYQQLGFTALLRVTYWVGTRATRSP